MENIINSLHKEIFEDHIYSQFVSVEKDDIVVDCGASFGIFADYAKGLGAKEIFCFEADKKIFLELLKKDVVSKNVTLCGKFSFGEIDFCFQNQIFAENTYDLEECFNSTKKQNIDFCKIDIEGSEYGFILDSDDQTIKRCKKYAIEFHQTGKIQSLKREYQRSIEVMERFCNLNYQIFCKRPLTDVLAKNLPVTKTFMFYAKLH